MVLGWFGGAKEESLPELIARKKYAQAVELLRVQYQRGGRDPRLRMQLADVLVAAGRRAEAVPIYLELADGYAREGYVAKAIAVLKKIERFDPARADVQGRLRQLAAERHRPPQAERSSQTTQTLEIGMEEIGLEPHLFTPDASTGTAPPSAEPAAAPVAPPAAEAGRGRDAPPAPARVSEAEFDLGEELLPEVVEPPPAEPSESVYEEEFFDVLAETVKATAVEATAPVRSVRSPLFEDFTDEEFLAVAARLELHSCAPGDILISEGEPGDSLFVLSTGVVKAFVRNPAGRNVLVREMGEGSFFGEISILTRKPRTATITCATACELLELDRDALDGIVRAHPRVQQVLSAFYQQRHGSGEERRVRGTSAAEAKS
jgi:hypothetical protein